MSHGILARANYAQRRIFVSWRDLSFYDLIAALTHEIARLPITIETIVPRRESGGRITRNRSAAGSFVRPYFYFLTTFSIRLVIVSDWLMTQSRSSRKWRGSSISRLLAFMAGRILPIIHCEFWRRELRRSSGHLSNVKACNKQ